jgi:hypothetical protein
MPYYRNYQNGGRVDPGLIKNWFAENYGTDIDAVEGLIGQISKAESDNRNIVQTIEGGGEGKGRGYFQFETKEGSGAFQSALTRTATLYEKLGKNVPIWVKNAKKSDDATTLDRGQQEEVLLADLAMKRVQKTKGLGDELIRGALESGSAKDLWLQAHWAGKKEDKKEKSKYWDEKFGIPETPETPGMADGGDVRGQSTDTVPAMLTPGEFVIRKDAADKIGPEKLQMLNNIDRLSDTALLENAKSPMGYQKGGKVKQEADCEGGECAVPTIASQTGLFSMPWKGKDVQIDLMSAMGDRAAPQYMASDAAGEYFMMDAGDIPADSLKAWWNQMVGSTTSSIFEKQEGGYINGYQKGGLVGMLGDFIGGQKENWARAKTMGEETGVRNPFLRTKDEQLAQMQGAGTMPRGGWLEKKMPQAYGEGDNPEVSGPSQQKMVEQESEILSNATINGQSATQSQIDAAMEKARQGLAAKKEPHVSALTGGIASTGEAYAKTTKEIGEREALYSAIPELGEVGTYGLGYRGTPEDLKKTTVEDYLFAMFNEPTKGSAGQGYRAVEDAVNALMGPESARLKEEAREAGDPSTKAEFYRDIVRGKGHGDAQREAFEELTKGYGSWTVPGVSVEPEGGWAEDVLTGKKHKELWEKASPREQAKRREVEAFAVPARHYAVRELLSKLKGAGADSGWGEYIQGRYGKSNGGYIHGYQEGGEVMNYQDGGQLKDVLSIFGEKSKQGDEMQKLMAMAAMQQMQRAQQVQQAIGMQGGGYADEYQQGGAVEPPMSGPESGPQEAPLPGGDQTYHQPAMEQLDMDQYEYASYVEHGPDMYKWMAPKYKSKQQWAPYDAMVDAGIIDPYEIGKDEISVVTKDQIEALSNQAKESMRV